jgi:hypothetical protein
VKVVKVFWASDALQDELRRLGWEVAVMLSDRSAGPRGGEASGRGIQVVIRRRARERARDDSKWSSIRQHRGSLIDEGNRQPAAVANQSPWQSRCHRFLLEAFGRKTADRFAALGVGDEVAILVRINATSTTSRSGVRTGDGAAADRSHSSKAGLRAVFDAAVDAVRSLRQRFKS